MSSESVEMYLITTAMLRRGQKPVPLSRLAEKLAISPVSTNEMCRKLAEQGLVEYQPYKGVTLTAEGNALAQRILRRRRLWETFLTEKLHIDDEEADDIACQLEHVSSENLTERLASFLDRPVHETLSEHNVQATTPPIETMSNLTAGQWGRVSSIAADDVVRYFLRGQGICEGIDVEVLAVGADGCMLLETSDHCLSLSRAVANHVGVVPVVIEQPED